MHYHTLFEIQNVPQLRFIAFPNQYSAHNSFPCNLICFMIIVCITGALRWKRPWHLRNLSPKMSQISQCAPLVWNGRKNGIFEHVVAEKTRDWQATLFLHPLKLKLMKTLNDRSKWSQTWSIDHQNLPKTIQSNLDMVKLDVVERRIFIYLVWT